ncbi:MAG: type IV toxin-antitoxin system AbiEi family antitoxin domain-containing protein [Candidatus Tyrphobacter sp.]
MIKSSRTQAKDYLTQLSEAGRYLFTSGEAREALGVSSSAAKLALNRLRHKGVIGSPARGFYAQAALAEEVSRIPPRSMSVPNRSSIQAGQTSLLRRGA